MKAWLFLLILLLSGSARPALFLQEFRSSLLTEEERFFHQPIFFPLSLGERGRLSAISFAGMPPWFLTLEVDGFPFENRLYGYWNWQTIPTFRIGQRQWVFFQPGWSLKPVRLARQAPRTDVVFSQDFVTGLSYLDIDFQQPISDQEYLLLGGNNFLREGTLAADFSATRVNTYQARLLKKLSSDWMLTGNYWQLRHRYRLPPESALSFRGDKFQQITHLLWFTVNGALTDRDSLWVSPGIQFFADDYWQSGQRQRSLESRQATVRLRYHHVAGAWKVGLEARAEQVRASGRIRWPTRREALLRAEPFIHWQKSALDMHLQLGYLWHSALEGNLLGKFSFASRIQRSIRLRVNLFQQATPPALLWRSIQDTSLHNLTTHQLLLARGAGIDLQIGRGEQWRVQLEPFWVQLQNDPQPGPALQAWQTMVRSNYGLRFSGYLQAGGLRLENRQVWNGKFRQAFAPQWHSVTILRLQQALFQGHLQVFGALVWHYLGKRKTIGFHRLLGFFSLQDTMEPPAQLLDGRIHLRIGDATVYFVWENLLSTDYQIVQGSLEQFRLFRFGVDWVLFD